MTSSRDTVTPPALSGRIFDIQRFSIHDGPGIRTTVFVKGCPLNCAWCHNPESMSRQISIAFNPDKCLGCGACVSACPQQAHQLLDGRHDYDRSLCQHCGACTTECYAQALEQVGRDASVEEIIQEVLRDQAFYDSSGGGLTISGGEPTYQIEFTTTLLQAAKQAGLHCAVESSLLCSTDKLDAMRLMVDLFLCDWKETDPKLHKQFTGVDNHLIADNLRYLDRAGHPIRLRCPIVPGMNNRDEHFQGIARLSQELQHLDGVELLAYHRLGEGKIERFGLDPSRRPQIDSASDEQKQQWQQRCQELGVQKLLTDS